jgi:hypothetical protein
MYSAEGELRALVRVQGTAREVTPAALEAYIAAQTRDRTLVASDWLRRKHSDMPVPQYQPWFQTVLVDPSGLIWAEEYNFDRIAPNTWWAIAEDGVVGYINVPSRVRITQVGDDFVLGIWHDPLDVPHVRLYRLNRPAGSSWVAVGTTPHGT